MSDLPEAYASLPLWEYGVAGPLRERLNGLTLAGAKTTSFGLDPLSRANGDAVEEVGDRFLMVGSDGRPLAVLEIVGIERQAMRDARWEQVDAEGESFLSVAEWMDGHLAFFAPFVEEIRAHLGDPDWELTPDTELTCFHVAVVERLPGADQGRQPVVECVVADAEAEPATEELRALGASSVERTTGGPVVRSTDGATVHAGEVLLRALFDTDATAVGAEATLTAKTTLDRGRRPRYEVLLTAP